MDGACGAICKRRPTPLAELKLGTVTKQMLGFLGEPFGFVQREATTKSYRE